MLGAGDQVLQAVRQKVQRRHAQPRLDIRERQAETDGIGRPRTAQLFRQRLESRLRRAERGVVGLREIDADSGQREMRGDELGVALVGGIAVRREEGRNDVPRRGQLRQPRDDGGIESAAEPDDEAARAARAELAPHPSRNSFR